MTTEPIVLDETHEVAPDEGPRLGRPRVNKVVAGVLAVVAVAATVTTLVEFSELRSNARRADDRRAAVAAAEKVAVGLATIDPKSAEVDISALADMGTGEFAKQLRTNLKSQVDLIKANKISSNGEVRGAGLVSLKGDDAVVAVAIESTVRNKSAREGEQRWYRMTVELQRQDNGSWLASEVVFVQ